MTFRPAGFGPVCEVGWGKCEARDTGSFTLRDLPFTFPFFSFQTAPHHQKIVGPRSVHSHAGFTQPVTKSQCQSSRCTALCSGGTVARCAFLPRRGEAALRACVEAARCACVGSQLFDAHQYWAEPGCGKTRALTQDFVWKCHIVSAISGKIKILFSLEAVIKNFGV